VTYDTLGVTTHKSSKPINIIDVNALNKDALHIQTSNEINYGCQINALTKALTR